MGLQPSGVPPVEPYGVTPLAARPRRATRPTVGWSTIAWPLSGGSTRRIGSACGCLGSSASAANARYTDLRGRNTATSAWESGIPTSIGQPGSSTGHSSFATAPASRRPRTNVTRQAALTRHHTFEAARHTTGQAPFRQLLVSPGAESWPTIHGTEDAPRWAYRRQTSWRLVACRTLPPPATHGIWIAAPRTTRTRYAG